MQFRVGDTVFNYAGEPGVIKDRKVQSGEYVLDPKGATLAEVQKRGYINGLSADLRQEFNAVMDQVRDIPEPEKRVNMLSEKIEEKKTVGDPKSRLVAKYLNAEMQHIMLTNNITNRQYTIEELKANE